MHCTLQTFTYAVHARLIQSAVCPCASVRRFSRRSRLARRFSRRSRTVLRVVPVLLVARSSKSLGSSRFESSSSLRHVFDRSLSCCNAVHLLSLCRLCSQSSCSTATANSRAALHSRPPSHLILATPATHDAASEVILVDCFVFRILSCPSTRQYFMSPIDS